MRGGLTAGVVACLLGMAAPALGAPQPVGDGAWSWFGDPRAVTHDGRTYVGWVDHQGDIKVSSYDHATGNRVTAMLQARLNQDDHANPSIHVRPDGRLVVFYSRHVGPSMHYRVSAQPGDVTSWGAPQPIPTNTSGIRGYTYPNPIRLPAENRTYLFWRGGNYNPTFSTQNDGEATWSTARTLISIAGERPYAKYAASGGDTIHVAYTDAHPGEYADVNIHYARIRGGRIERSDGTQVGSLTDPIAPGEGDLVFNPAEPTWVHDVAADSAGNPVIVFARLFSSTDHRYYYARREAGAWQVRLITQAGGTFREDGGSPYYSGGLTLDHEDPSRVYLSRQTGPGTWQVETWTTPDGGVSWTSQPVSGPGKNVRPVSPRGMTAFDGPMSVIWMRGGYRDYVSYTTQIDALMPDAANVPPIADAEPDVRAGAAPLAVRFDASISRDPDGSIASYAWDFGDGTTGTGVAPAHTYAVGGRYFPTLTVTDNAGASTTLVEEIAVDLPAAPTVHTGGASGTTVHGAIVPQNRATTWSVEYGPTTEYGAVTATRSLPADANLHQVSTTLPGLTAGRIYHYRVVASNATGSTSGEDRVFRAHSSSASDAYRDAVMRTPGLARYWRLGELSGLVARDEVSRTTAPFEGRFVLGQLGVLGPLGNTATSFDGRSGAVIAAAPALSTNATLEGWFRWRAGTAVLRDNTGPSGGWLLPFNRDGALAYRLGGSGFTTSIPVDTVRDGQWHHIAATKAGGAAALYIDGTLRHSAASGAGSTPSASPFHIMRNGSNAVFADGEADEVALYTRALSATEVRNRFTIARSLASASIAGKAAATSSAAEPPLAGSGRAGGVLTPVDGAAASAPAPAGLAAIRKGTLTVRGAAGVTNDLSVRRRGGAWIARDALARLRAGAGCRRVSARVVRCRVLRVRRIALFGGAGDDRLTVFGRVAARLVGGPGRDVTHRRLR